MNKTHRGFSLIELMISVVLGLVLMTGVIQMFLSSRSAFSSQQAMSRVQETGRLAVEFMAKDIRMAGYMGCVSKLTAPTTTLNSPALFTNDMLTPVRGYTAEPAGAALTPNPKANTDLFQVTGAQSGNSAVVTVNNSNTTVFARLTTNEPGACTRNTGAPTNRLSGMCRNDFLVVTDCLKAQVFEASALTVAGTTVQITHVVAGAAATPAQPATPGNTSDSWGTAPIPNPIFGPGSEINVVTKTVYFIARNTTTGRESLWQNVNGLNTELLEGVTDMIVLYGRDTNADDIPDLYNTAAQIDAANAWPRVLSVRVSILVESLDDNVMPDEQTFQFGDPAVKPAKGPDRRLRQVFTSTVGIRSRLP